MRCLLYLKGFSELGTRFLQVGIGSLLPPAPPKLEMQDLLLQQSKERCADAVLGDFLLFLKAPVLLL